jgi:DNA-binding NarL/FixJ family response regulator
MSKIRILLADDHALVRKGLRLLIEVARGNGSCRRGLRRGARPSNFAGELKPEIAILDIAMPNLNGIDAAAQLAKRGDKVRVIILSMHSDESYVVRALDAGRAGVSFEGLR